MGQPRPKNKAPKRPFLDPIIERVQQAQEILLKQFGSYDALMDHFQELDRQRAIKKRTTKRSIRVTRNDTVKPSPAKRRTRKPIEDEIMRRLREAREQLLKEHGSFENYFKHLQKLDREYSAGKNAKGKSRTKTARRAS